jgi:xylulose-5-phosphate/fructose-6-phosphate phosphoketolase
MIFLHDNTLLKRDLTFDDIKPRLLGELNLVYSSMRSLRVLIDRFCAGHWGTCPGLVMVYSHLNYIIRIKNLDMLYVVGPGHGAPGILAALWLEGSLEKFYPEYSRDSKGLHQLVSTFSTTAGLPRLASLDGLISTIHTR